MASPKMRAMRSDTAADRRRVTRHVATLEKRRRYLQDQVRIRTREGLPADFARAEQAAITHALAVMEDAETIGLPHLGRLDGYERKAIRTALAQAVTAA